MKMIIIKQDTKDWNFMWDWLTKHPLNKDNENPTQCNNNGEVWQYMGSYQSDLKVISEFRHRNHPMTNRVERVSVKHIDFDIKSILEK